MEKRFKRFVEVLYNHSIITMFSAFLIELLVLVAFFASKTSNIILSAFGIAIPVLAYYFVNSFIEDEKKKNFVFGLFKLCLLMSVLIVINNIFFMLLCGEGGKMTPSHVSILCLIVDILIAIFLGYSIGTESVVPFFDSLKEFNLWRLLGLKLFTPVVEKGDVVLCENKDTGIPVMLHYGDRFLHMLVLGPTGCGKTSQILIPLLNQDIQNLNAGITVIEPKGDLADKIYAMAQYYGREALYFNPILDSCPTFNPLYGREENVIENIVTTFKMLDPDSPQFFKDMNEQLLRNALKVLKRLMGNQATMIDLSTLVSNTGGEGRKLIQSFSKISATTASLAKENADIANYFLSDYLAEKSRIYDNTSGVRSQIAKIVSNKFLRKVLNPENGKSDIDFDKHLANNGIICISTAQGQLRDLGSFLGYFIILNFQSSVFKRPGNEFSRSPHFLYIDEFQTYSNPGFAAMLTQGRSYRVASHLATQNRALIGMGSGRDGKNFIELVSTNARNVVIFPGANYADAKYYSDQFGEVTERKRQEGVTRQKFNPLFFSKLNPPSESIRYSEEDVARYSSTDLTYQKFGTIAYSLVCKNSVSTPGMGTVNYIPKDLNETLNVMLAENEVFLTQGYDANLCRILSEHGRIKEEIDMEKVYKEFYEKKLADEDYDSPKTQKDGTVSDTAPPSAPKSSPTPSTTINDISKPPATSGDASSKISLEIEDDDEL